MNAYFTLTSNEFVPGAICLIKSLRRFTDLPIHVIDLDLTEENRKLLENHSAIITRVDRIGSIYAKTQPWHQNKDFANNCFNKLHLWNQNYDKVIYLDSDMLVVKNIDSLFKLDVEFAACPAYVKTYKPTKSLISAGYSEEWFNGGFLFLKPDPKVFADLIEKKDLIECKRDPSDQGFLNEYYKGKWHRLSSIFNATRRVFMSAPAEWKAWCHDIAVIHYTIEKPWIKPVLGCESIEREWWECYRS